MSDPTTEAVKTAQPEAKLVDQGPGILRVWHVYGLVNKAVEDLVVTRFGPETWQEIRHRAGVGIPSFVGMISYSDDVTYKLVGAASEVLGLPADEILEAFGEYWILYTAKEGYGDLLEMAGHSVVEFLQNTDHLHARIRLILPDLAPPRLWCTDIEEGSVRVHYDTDREALAPMVIGLLKGLGKRFETPVTVVHDKVRGQDGDHDEFIVRFLEAT